VGLSETVSVDADLFQLVEDVRVFGGWLKETAKFIGPTRTL
jgi:hypothetical protein